MENLNFHYANKPLSQNEKCFIYLELREYHFSLRKHILYENLQYGNILNNRMQFLSSFISFFFNSYQLQALKFTQNSISKKKKRVKNLSIYLQKEKSIYIYTKR